MKLIDISMDVKKDMIVYPGNPKPKFKQYAKIPKNGTNETLITIGSHTGSHVDAPLHVKNNAKSASKIPLENFYGKCRVLDLTNVGKEIHSHHLEKFKIKKGEIILLKTENSKKQYKKFRENFAHVKLCVAKYLRKKKVKTLGIDYLSVKKFGGDNDVHEIIIKNMTLFEGLCLKNVKPGNYTFAGLPLKLDLDGAPARVILIK